MKWGYESTKDSFRYHDLERIVNYGVNLVYGQFRLLTTSDHS